MHSCSGKWEYVRKYNRVCSLLLGEGRECTEKFLLDAIIASYQLFNGDVCP